jgi:tetratricopeptide (TPR) repeat protein
MIGVGWRYQQAGDLARAEQTYLQVLGLDTEQPDAWYLLGVVCHVQGRLAEAVSHYERSLALRHDHADTQNNLGAAYDVLGRTDEAIGCFREAVRLNPDFADAAYSLGTIYERRGQEEESLRYFKESIPAFERILERRPDLGEARYKLGSALARAGRLDEATESLQHAIGLMPYSAEAHHDLGWIQQTRSKHEEALAYFDKALWLRPEFATAHSNKGLSLVALKRTAEAIPHYREALRLEPDFAQAHNNLGLALAELEQLDEAIHHYQEALRLRPNFAEAYCNWGTLLGKELRFEESGACFQKALQIKPGLPEAHSALGATLQQQQKLEEALVCYEEALRLKPDSADTHVKRGMVWLQQGKLDKGWPEYEWRLQVDEIPKRNFTQPLWDGSPLDGRTILLHAEQGLGDTIQFMRYAPLVRERGGRPIIECQKSLVPLLSRCPGIEQVVPLGSALPPFDLQAPLLSLPGIFGTALSTVPAAVPYLFPDPELVVRWREELSKLEGIRVGIAWQGNPKYSHDKRRSIPLKFFGSFSRVAGVQFISLQKGVGTEQLSGLPEGLRVLDLGDRLDEAAGPFMDTAAIMKNLDLVITSDTAIPHLAGALGVPVWLALASVVDWRWLIDREDCPWYPTMRLFRQEEPGKWEHVFERMASELKERVQSGSDRRSVSHSEKP